MKYKLIILLLGISLSLVALNDNAGTTAFNFFKIRYSPRAAAMGDAYVALADDGYAAVYNAAGMQQLTQKEVYSTYTNYFMDYQGGGLIFAKPWGDNTSLGYFFEYLTSGDITKTTINSSGNYDPTQNSVFSNSNILVGLSYGRVLNRVLDLGLSFKYLRESIDGQAGSAIATDVSLMHQTSNEKLKVSVVFRNMGKQITAYSDDGNYKEKMPRSVSAGFAYKSNPKLTLTGEIYKPFALDLSVRFGAEYVIHPMLKLRGGYKTNNADWKLGGDDASLAGFSFGLGTIHKSIIFDYAYASYGDLSALHMVALGYRW